MKNSPTEQERTHEKQDVRKETSEIVDEVIILKFEQLKEENEKLAEQIRDYSDRCLKAMYVALLILTLLLSIKLEGREDKFYYMHDLLEDAMELSFSQFYAFLILLNILFVIVVLLSSILFFFSGFFFKGISYKITLDYKNIWDLEDVTTIKRELGNKYEKHLEENKNTLVSLHKTYYEGSAILFFGAFLVVLNIVFIFAQIAELLCGLNMGMILLLLILSLAYFRKGRGEMAVKLSLFPLSFLLLTMVLGSLFIEIFEKDKLPSTGHICYFFIGYLVIAFLIKRKLRKYEKPKEKTEVALPRDFLFLSSVYILLVLDYLLILKEELESTFILTFITALTCVAFFVSELSKNENITSEVKPKEKKSLPTILSNLREKIETYLNRKFSKLQKQPKISEEEDDNE